MTVSAPVLHLGRTTVVGPLTWAPVWTDEAGVPGLEIGAGDVTVTELPDDPQVDHLRVANHGSALTLLLDGELLEGGMQHRTAVHDVLLTPGTALDVPVACVEAGRWAGPGDHRRSGRRVAPAVRAALLRSEGGRQHEVWRRVAAYEAGLGTSATSAYVERVDGRTSTGGRWLAQALGLAEPVCPLPGQTGVAIGAMGYPLVVELFPSADALGALLPDLLGSVLVDLAGPSTDDVEPVPGRRFRRLMERLDGLELTPAATEPVDGANHVAATTQAVAVRGTRIGERWAHLTVYNRRHMLLGLADRHAC